MLVMVVVMEGVELAMEELDLHRLKDDGRASRREEDDESCFQRCADDGSARKRRLEDDEEWEQRWG